VRTDRCQGVGNLGRWRRWIEEDNKSMECTKGEQKEPPNDKVSNTYE